MRKTDSIMGLDPKLYERYFHKEEQGLRPRITSSRSPRVAEHIQP